MKMTTKDVKEITYMPLVTFFSVLEQPGKNRKGGCNNPPWLDEGYIGHNRVGRSQILVTD